MKHSFQTGFSFGLTSGIITTLGLIVGLNSGTHSKLAVIGGILVIAIADAFSDSLGIHISEESENVHSPREVWEATASTFFSKFVVAITFVLPVLFLTLNTAIIISIVWGFTLLGLFSAYMARQQNEKIWRVVSEHIFIGIVVVTATHLVGHLIAKYLPGVNG